MSTTLEFLTEQQADLQERLAKAVKSKKSTKTLREQLEQVQTQVEQFTAEAVEVQPAKRGRPRSKSPEFYVLRDSLKRGKRGRPSRAETVSTLRFLNVDLSDLNLEGTDEVEAVSTRQLELMLLVESQVALRNAR